MKRDGKLKCDKFNPYSKVFSENPIADSKRFKRILKRRNKKNNKGVR